MNLEEDLKQQEARIAKLSKAKLTKSFSPAEKILAERQALLESLLNDKEAGR